MQIQQLFRDNAKIKKSVCNAVRNGDSVRINIYDIIDSYWGFSAANMLDAITQAGNATQLDVYFNSPGGDVFESRAIMAELRRFPGKTVAHIDSLCASAATSIALACDEVEMSDGAFFMIHNAQGLAYGDKNELRSTADLLEKIETAIVTDYTSKTGKDATQIAAWMNAETWFTATEALQEGFVDRLTPAAAKTAANQWDLSAYANAPRVAAPPDTITAQHREALNRRNRLSSLAIHQ